MISAWKLGAMVVMVVTVWGATAAGQSSDGQLAAEAAAIARLAAEGAPLAEPRGPVPVPKAAVPPGATVYYFSDFEADDGGLVGVLDWQWGEYAWSAGPTCDTPNLEVPPPAAFSGTRMWGTVLNDCYNARGNNADYLTCNNASAADDSVLSLTVDLRTASTAWLSWAEWFDVGLIFDWVEVRVDGTVVDQRCGEDYTVPTAWQLREIDLTSFVGTQPTIELRMMSSSAFNFAGWYLDDLLVADFQPSLLIFTDGFESGTTDAWSSAVP